MNIIPMIDASITMISPKFATSHFFNYVFNISQQKNMICLPFSHLDHPKGHDLPT